MSIHRTRGRQRRALRSPFLLTIIAAVLGAVGFSQFNTPLVSVALFPAPTPTALVTAAARSTPIATLATRVPIPTGTATRPPASPLPSRTATVTATAVPPTATPSGTATASPSPSATWTVMTVPLETATAEATVEPTETTTASAAPTVREARVPILMYHHVGALPPDADAVRKSLTVSQENFEAQIKFLADQGYTTLRIADLVLALQSGAPLPDKAIILTFDDGYEDNYTNVFPTLKDFGFTGTFFIIGAPTDYGSPGYLRWEQVLEMYQNGMEIGSHSLTHRYNLGTTRPSTQEVEIKSAHKLLADHLPDWTPIFSYPSGSYNQYSLDLLQSLGYIAAVSTRQGTLQSSAQPFELRRIRIRGEWSLPQFVYWFNYWTARP